ncbi:type II secretion system GspH family protein [Cytobacillus spongiae]|jgi:type II secretory pathway pseudopilin PulG|uniref:type IV pilus modification PilV family protein n=1 Tax=Cytobacillus spongiae TaxID=2901381 RepID=UPI001F487E0C|nr:type II secretion system protein [Cytobacillus spongiae]UII55054.1 type II secretion system GspH family protein [Cytobacillus spongiae]
MINCKFLRTETGVTLIEILLSITILGIVFLSVLSLFNQAYSYTERNEDKTVGINVARNVLYYMEQQDYDVFKDYYWTTSEWNDSTPVQKELTLTNCEDKNSSSNEHIFEESVCKGFFTTRINNQVFNTKVVVESHGDPKLKEYLIPVEVHVSWGDQTATVRGVIKDE